MASPSPPPDTTTRTGHPCWASARSLLPSTKEGLRLEFGSQVERSVVLLLQQAADLLYGEEGGLHSKPLQDTLLGLSETICDYSWEKLNIGTWRDVDRDWRRVYAYGCLFQVLCLCHNGGASPEALRVCDLGLLMGVPILDNILVRLIGILQQHLPGPRRPPIEEPARKVCGSVQLPAPEPSLGAKAAGPTCLRLCTILAFRASRW